VIERIVGAQGKGENRRFLVKWEGYMEKDNTWEPLSEVLRYPWTRGLMEEW
jgi:hypothetical protein